jgi:plastocyanin
VVKNPVGGSTSQLLGGRVRIKTKTLLSLVALATITVPVLTAGVAGASGDGPKHVSVNITGADNFVHPGLITNNFSFPSKPISVRPGGTITFTNLTDEGHTISLVGPSDVPTTTSQVDHCAICDLINGAWGLNGGPPNAAQLDTGQVGTALDGTFQPPGFPILVAIFDVASHGTSVGDATIIDTSDPTNGSGFPTQRTIQVSNTPGLYHYICTFHPWMQGTIRVGGDN